MNTRRRLSLGREDGAVTVMAVVIMGVLLVTGSLAVDVGNLWVVRTRLQKAADASALAAAAALPNEGPVLGGAAKYSDLNADGHPGILDPKDVEIGYWDLDARTFTVGANPRNSVRVRVERSEARRNAVPLSFARLLGKHLGNVQASATAYSPSGTAGTGTRFLVDEELIDSDVPSIEDLARRLGKDSEEIISDNDGDWFIDLPPGTELTLPTGQVADEGLFDVTHESFPFSDHSDPSYTDFLNYNEDGTWRQDLVPKHMLDPLLGPDGVDDANRYPDFVDPDFCNVSPVFKSDISQLDPIGDTPAVEIQNVNALGERRGLLSFSIIAIGEDPDGPSGSYLPDIVIRVCEPVPVDDVGSPSGVGGVRVVLVE